MRAIDAYNMLLASDYPGFVPFQKIVNSENDLFFISRSPICLAMSLVDIIFMRNYDITPVIFLKNDEEYIFTGYDIEQKPRSHTKIIHYNDQVAYVIPRIRMEVDRFVYGVGPKHDKVMPIIELLGTDADRMRRAIAVTFCKSVWKTVTIEEVGHASERSTELHWDSKEDFGGVF